MSKLTAPEVTSYAGAATSVGASLALADIGIWVGIATAVLTFLLNAIYMHLKYRGEKRERDARMKQLEGE